MENKCFECKINEINKGCNVTLRIVSEETLWPWIKRYFCSVPCLQKYRIENMCEQCDAETSLLTICKKTKKRLCYDASGKGCANKKMIWDAILYELEKKKNTSAFTQLLSFGTDFKEQIKNVMEDIQKNGPLDNFDEKYSKWISFFSEVDMEQQKTLIKIVRGGNQLKLKMKFIMQEIMKEDDEKDE